GVGVLRGARGRLLVPYTTRFRSTEHLSRVVDVMNERVGLGLGDADQLRFDQFEESWAADESLAARARNNDFQNFRLVFDRTFLEDRKSTRLNSSHLVISYAVFCL